MASTKVTFTLDGASLNRLQDASERLGKAKSEVVREAIAEYHGRIGQLSDRERQRMLRVLDEMVPKILNRPIEEVERELSEIREARRTGGRLTVSE